MANDNIGKQYCGAGYISESCSSTPTAGDASARRYLTQDDTVENRLVQITSIEVKASATVDGKDFKGLRHLQATEGAIYLLLYLVLSVAIVKSST